MRSPSLLAVLALLCPCCGESPAPRAPQPEDASAPAPDRTSGALAAPQPAPVGAPEPVARPASILFDEQLRDFGTVSDVHDLEHSFSFMNTGDEPLLIGEIDASCGCTATALARTEIEPGGVEVLGVVWDTIGSGRQHKTITVHSNDEARGPVVLTVAATIEPFARLEPAGVGFGAVSNRAQHTLRFQVTCQDPDFTIVSFETPDDVDFVVVEPPAAGRAVLDALLQPTQRRGNYVPRTSIRLGGRLAGEDVTHDLPVKVTANLYTELLVEPPLVAVGKVRVGQEVEYRLRVTRPSGGRFRITTAELRNSTVTGLAARAVEDADGFAVVLSGTVGPERGPLRGQLVLETDLAGEPSRAIAVLGMVE